MAALLFALLLPVAAALSAYTGKGFRVVRWFPGLPRREADAVVLAGRVRVNGEQAAPSLRLRSGDRLSLDGKARDWEALAEALEGENGGGLLRYWAYAKPVGVTCTTDRNDRRSLRRAPELSDLFAGSRVFPMGRLDLDSEGLVILTNDGATADAALQPRSKLDKCYEVDLDRRCSDADVEQLAAGVRITTPLQRGKQVEREATTLPCSVERGAGTRLVVTLSEGRNRQLRRMAAALGYEVTSLRRVRFGPVALGDLAPRGVRALTESEIGGLRANKAKNQQRRRRPSRSKR